MGKQQKLSSFQTLWIFGCAVGFTGLILSESSFVLSGFALLAIGAVAGILKK